MSIKYTETKAIRTYRTLTVDREPTESQLLTVARDLQVVAQRDRLLADLCQATEPGHRVRAAGRLQSAALLTGGQYRAPLYAVAASCLYQEGHMHGARAAVEYALLATPGYRLAVLLSELLESGIPGHMYGESMARVPRDEIARRAVPVTL